MIRFIASTSCVWHLKNTFKARGQAELQFYPTFLPLVLDIDVLVYCQHNSYSYFIYKILKNISARNLNVLYDSS